MAAGVLEIIPESLTGIISCPVRPESPVHGFRILHSAGTRCRTKIRLRAGEAILATPARLPDNSLVLFLISGGASAIAEQPLYPYLTLSDIMDTNRALVHSGAPIAEINAIRKHLSAIKGGRMAQAAFPAEQLSLLVSDVPDQPSMRLRRVPQCQTAARSPTVTTLRTAIHLEQRFPGRVRDGI